VPNPGAAPVPGDPQMRPGLLVSELQKFGYTKMMRFPSGLGAIGATPSWRGVNEIFDPSGREV